jgi:hypothetical protein
MHAFAAADVRSAQSTNRRYRVARRCDGAASTVSRRRWDRGGGGNVDGGLLVLPDASNSARGGLIIALAERYRLPAVYVNRRFAAFGGLMSYGIDIDDMFRRAADYVDRIFNGEKPSDLPVQNPTKFQLVINLKTAEALDITITPTLLATGKRWIAAVRVQKVGY